MIYANLLAEYGLLNNSEIIDQETKALDIFAMANRLSGIDPELDALLEEIKLHARE